MPPKVTYTMPKNDNPDVTAIGADIRAAAPGQLEHILKRSTPGPRVIEEEEPDHTVITEERVDHDANDNMAAVAKEQTEATTGMSLTMMVLIGVVVLAAMYFLTKKSGSPTPPPSQGGGGGVQGSIGPQGASMQGGGMNAQFSR